MIIVVELLLCVSCVVVADIIFVCLFSDLFIEFSCVQPTYDFVMNWTYNFYSYALEIAWNVE